MDKGKSFWIWNDEKDWKSSFAYLYVKFLVGKLILLEAQKYLVLSNEM